jgi:threonine/homoserine/homoserine lactone efflux protein
MKGENQLLIIIGVSLAGLAVLALVTESYIITNCVFAFGIIFIVLMVYRLTRPRNEQETPMQKGADHETQRPKDHKRRPPRRRGPKGRPSS